MIFTRVFCISAGSSPAKMMIIFLYCSFLALSKVLISSFMSQRSNHISGLSLFHGASFILLRSVRMTSSSTFTSTFLTVTSLLTSFAAFLLFWILLTHETGKTSQILCQNHAKSTVLNYLRHLKLRPMLNHLT